MIDGELTAAVEQFRQRDRTAGRIKGVSLVDLHPRKFAAFRGELIARASEFFFFAEELFADREPFVFGDDGRFFERVGFQRM